VQLELWQGLNILASAPLLLLPPLPSPSSTDPLLEELDQHVAQASWVQEEEGSSTGVAGNEAGIAAFLTDLGQLLFTTDCIGSSSPQAHGQRSDAGVPAWGGVGPALIHQHSQDPDLLSSSLNTAEGLLEFARSGNLLQVAQLVEFVWQCISQQLQNISANSYGSEQAAGAAKLASRLSGSPAGMTARQLTLKECILTTIHGFRPHSLEGEYSVWAAQRCTPLLMAWKPFFLVWMVASIIGSIRRGEAFNYGDIPVHIIMSSAHVATVFLALAGLHRWGALPVLSRHGTSIAPQLQRKLLKAPWGRQQVCLPAQVSCKLQF
jgi:hypothetical protein